MKHTFFLTFVTILFIVFSCNKNSDEIIPLSKKDNLIKKAQDWDLKKTKTSRNSNKFQKWTRKWNDAESTTDKNGNTIIYVPTKRNKEMKSILNYKPFMLFIFDNNHEIQYSEAIHIIDNSNTEISKIIKERNEGYISGFSGYILKEFGNIVIGNYFDNGSKSNVTVLKEDANISIKNTRISSQECWRTFLQIINLSTGDVVSEETLYYTCYDSPSFGGPNDNTTLQMDPNSGEGSWSSNYGSSYIDSNELTDPCFIASLNEIISSNRLGSILEPMISNLALKPNIYISLTQENHPNSTKDARVFDTRQNDVIIAYNIVLNNNGLSGAGKEYITATILHELIHVHLKVNNISLEGQHSHMADNYVNSMANALTFMYGLNLDDSRALSWSGLENTPAFRNLPYDLQYSYAMKNLYYRNSGGNRTNAPGTKCN